MARRFCTDCDTFHDGACSPAALARAGKSKPAKGKKSNGSSSRNVPSSPAQQSAPPETPVAVPAAEDDSPDQENVGAADKPVEIAPETFSKEYVDGLLAEIAAFKTADEARKAKLRGYVEKHRAERAKKEAKT